MIDISGKRILIVGAGFGQLPLIEKSLELDLDIIVIDKNPNAIGMKMVEKSFPIDIIDVDAVKNLAEEYQIDGIVTMQTDLPIPTIGAVNDFLKLNGVTYDTAIRCSHKMETRKALKQKGVDQPNFEIVESEHETMISAKKIGLPVIVKAVDSSGSRGITKVSSFDKISEAYKEAKKYTRLDVVLVEEFIDGIEVGAQAFSEGGECKLVLVHNDTLADGEFMVPTGHSFPSSLDSEQENNAIDTVKKCVEALGINEGPSNIDLIINKNGEAKIIEVGARVGATCLPELVYNFTGIDWVENTILNALGEKVNVFPIKKQACAAVILESLEDGIVEDILIPETINENINLLELEVTVKKGDKVSKLRKGTDRIGKVVCVESTYEKAELLAESIKKEVQIKCLKQV
ncbi:ATP-grasp domain-containing protein [Aureibacter tunicatorum]|uniref:Biotin carboxylase n=1 Tax=Aureibacter tunicatorum TaxID=866807 RepID=A0AAE4BU60_9BACT|nr:ATP-grasp domain-containing protein [Aureibacter tunicatorum]MDR6240700.1 biotin carboxylase [Aureibacter tunicatorum]BDD06967.1 carbamoyl-phosphate-synthetase [Aureibacter tunicatorum]